MASKLRWGIPIALLAVAAVYLWPAPTQPFPTIYARVDPAIVADLQTYRNTHPERVVTVAALTWTYRVVGAGPETVVFLHGMTGADDIWWQQIEALQNDFKVVAVTYPEAQSLGEMERGLLAVLDQEGIERFSVVGSSLGGYFTQYLIARHPERITRAVLANTFPPNDLIAEKNRAIGTALPFLPEWLVLSTLRDSFANGVYPTSGNDALTLAFLNEIAYGRVSKAQVLGRYRCVVEPFEAPVIAIPLLIIESDNDPLVEAALREQLKTTYPAAEVHTFANAGHFPYLNHADAYTTVLKAFLQKP